MRFTRSAGILLHPTSLPSPYGIGDFGTSAYEFVRFLIDTKQTLWQILPLGPTGYGDSPYQCFSAFAGNTLLISPEKMVEHDYLPTSALKDVPNFPSKEVDYGWVIDYKNKLFDTAFAYVKDGFKNAEQQEAYARFTSDNAYWLEDYSLFIALKKRFKEHKGGVWNTWPRDIARRDPKAMAEWSHKLSDEIARERFLQFVFFEQWLSLKKYANENGVSIIGDIPIFVAFDSADTWANQSLFFLHDDGEPAVIAGVPPDYFSETGQRWGNPLYRWDKMKENKYAWWAKRLQMSFTQADIVRIDHFRGFEAYWEIPGTEPTAIKGRWVKGPGADLFEVLLKELGELPLIAEDLGLITPEVEVLRDQFNFPGMKILQFAFGGERNSNFLPHNFSPNCVVYTGTHDNETTVGWYHNANEDERDHVRRYLSISGHDIAWNLIRMAHRSVADMSVIMLQDLMGLNNTARMNFPGRTGGYWRWRYTPEMLTEHIAYRLSELTILYGRAPEQQDE